MVDLRIGREGRPEVTKAEEKILGNI